MNGWKTAGKWTLYAIGALIAYLVFDGMEKVDRLGVIVFVWGCWCLWSLGKERERDELRHQQKNANLHDLISAQEVAIWRLNDRIDKLEADRTPSYSDDA